MPSLQVARKPSPMSEKVQLFFSFGSAAGGDDAVVAVLGEISERDHLLVELAH